MAEVYVDSRMSGNIIMASGIPASGKSYYCDWLVRDKGFCAYSWDFAPPVDVHSEIKRLSNIRRRVAIDWGFPLSEVNTVERLKSFGVDIWWFDGDRATAKQSFIQRHQRGEHPGTLADLDKQLADIEANWEEIQRVFSNHFIESVLVGGYVPSERIYARMFGQCG